MWPDARVERFVAESFIPVRVHVREQAQAFQQLGKRYGVDWTPTTLVLSADGQEQHRIEGFLPTDDFLAALAVGLGRVDFARGNYGSAEHRFREVLARHPASDAAPEAMYWAGVARYKETNEPQALQQTAAAFRDRYQNSTWAKKASVWGG